MATYQNQNVHTFVSAGDLSTSQFRFLTVNTGGKVEVSGEGDDVIGILLNDPNGADQSAQVATFGISRIEAAEAIDGGAKVTPNASGQAVTAGSGDDVAGIVIDGASGAGEIVSIFLNPRGKV
jgi:hypothetical protein